MPGTAHGSLATAAAGAPLDAAPLERARSSSESTFPAACSCRINRTANKSSLLSWRALPLRRRLRRCAFFSSLAARLRSSRMRSCSAFMSAIFADNEISSVPLLEDVARRWSPRAATLRSAALRAAESESREPRLPVPLRPSSAMLQSWARR